MEIFRKRLRELREAKGFKQEYLAKALNISTSAYGYYEQGRNEPALETLIKLAQTFNVSTDYLLGLTDIPYTPAHIVAEDSSLYEAEQSAIEALKRTKLLKEISKNPDANIAKIERLWGFIQDELNDDQ
ncbi:helix-turn-helix domain-containing protein [Amphibacillus sediminis]|uniref:helix-turn-helix domain-containing protein n=1 Tax=Amphibacillus sediminis TaxID=360185 RepID=UPI0009FAC94C|nr:helix-turn-helix domain-containing protein [Amphibacillus sediminis]